jgi:transcriptional regulator with XRE-family HTH domain
MTNEELRLYIRRHSCTDKEVADILGISLAAVKAKLNNNHHGCRPFTEDEINRIVDVLKNRPTIPYFERHHMKQIAYRYNVSFQKSREDTKAHWIYKLVTSKGYTLESASVKLGYSRRRLSNAIFNEKIGIPIPMKLIEAIKNEL